jgi:hypothetical protein
LWGSQIGAAVQLNAEQIFVCATEKLNGTHFSGANRQLKPHATKLQ